MPDTFLEMKNISKTFPGVRALWEVTISLNRGETLALVGENGAGKSTLMKILGGVYRADKGEIFIDGEKAVIHTPLDSQKAGISMIFQEVNLVPSLSIAENMFLGKELAGGVFGRLDRNAMRKKSAEVLAQLGCGNLNTAATVKDLTMAKQQMVEIAKSLMNQSRIIVMDEPTSSLTGAETEALFGIIDVLKKQGIAVIYISHKLEEIERISDRIVVLRDGKFITELDNSKKNVEKNVIVKHMVGRDLTDFYPAGNAVIGEEVLRVVNLGLRGKFNRVSFELRQGEILGFSGLIGAGRTELAKTIFGEFKKDEGEIYLSGKPLNIENVRSAIKEGITLIPEDRKREGLVLCLSLADNICLPNAGEVSSAGIVSRGKKNGLVGRVINELQIRPALPHRAVVNFSGGNQQKTVIAKWLVKNPRVLILDEPTRGVDVGAKSEIYALMR
ncbi:MAG: sugar ABC transporter ATP-binding protein, partial [Treponema sp.]|nr:sugar ABC transporter ATP-binding protein [Treponema sp.]